MKRMLMKRGRDAVLWWVKGCKRERDYTEYVRDACKTGVGEDGRYADEEAREPFHWGVRWEARSSV